MKSENMPGVIYQLASPVKKVMVHHNGKLILWGAKSMDDMDLAFELMKKNLQEYAWTPRIDLTEEADKVEDDFEPGSA